MSIDRFNRSLKYCRYDSWNMSNYNNTKVDISIWGFWIYYDRPGLAIWISRLSWIICVHANSIDIGSEPRHYNRHPTESMREQTHQSLKVALISLATSSSKLALHIFSLAYVQSSQERLTLLPLKWCTVQHSVCPSTFSKLRKWIPP